MSLEAGSYYALKKIEQDVLRKKYNGCLVDGYVPLHEYYQQVGPYGENIPIVEPNDFRGRDRSSLESDAATRGMILQLMERAGMDEIALVPSMTIRSTSLQKDVVTSIMSQAQDALRRK